MSIFFTLAFILNGVLEAAVGRALSKSHLTYGMGLLTLLLATAMLVGWFALPPLHWIVLGLIKYGSWSILLVLAMLGWLDAIPGK